MTKKMHTFTSTRNNAIGREKLTWRHTDSRYKQFREKNPQHFFGSSCQTWIADEDFSRIYDALVKEGAAFSIWLIKQDISGDYDIENYAPKVPDDEMEYIGTWWHDKHNPEKFKK